MVHLSFGTWFINYGPNEYKYPVSFPKWSNPIQWTNINWVSIVCIEQKINRLVYAAFSQLLLHIWVLTKIEII